VVKIEENAKKKEENLINVGGNGGEYYNILILIFKN
jgi:hypothetical protein